MKRFVLAASVLASILASVYASHAQAQGIKVVRKVDFNDHPVGPYTRARLAADFGASGSSAIAKREADVVASGPNQRALRILFRKGSTGPVQWKAPLPPRDSYILQYKVLFPASFDWRKGGKIPGLAGGSAPTGGKDSSHGFSARYMWKNPPAGKALLYLYWPGRTMTFGDEIVFPLTWTKGKWHRITQYVDLNTSTRPGRIRVFMDGRRVHDANYELRKGGDTWKIDVFYFSTFFGGSGAKWAPTKDEHLYFDDFIIAYRE